MRCAIVVSGCTPGEADALRRAMSRKRSSAEMHAATDTIREGMQRRGIDTAAATRVLGWLEACASYTFPESHAISFALLAYASAWLRRYYPAEYLCSILNAQPMGFYPVSTLIHDATVHGVDVRPVDLAHSGWDCTLEAQRGHEDPAVRMGLRYVRGLGGRAREGIEEVLRGGSFSSVQDVLDRSGLGEAELRALAVAGAFRCWVPEPRRALWTVLGELRARRTGGPLAPAIAIPVPLPDLSPTEQTLQDHRSTGFDLVGHPMRHLRDRLCELGVHSVAELRRPGMKNGQRVKTAGLVIVRQRPGTSKGFVFLGIEDETGRLDVIVSPKLYARERATINSNGILAVQGILGVEEGVVNLRAQKFFPLRLENSSALIPAHDYR